jgi:hypothetical protein
VSTEVNMVLLMRGEQNGTPQVKFQPARFNLDTREGKLLQAEEAGEFHTFIADAITDMDTIASAHVLEHAKALRDNDGGPTVVGLSDEVRNDLYMRLLASFSEKPMELVGNMLAGMLVGCIEGMVEDENFDEVYAEFHSGDTAGE